MPDLLKIILLTMGDTAFWFIFLAVTTALNFFLYKYVTKNIAGRVRYVLGNFLALLIALLIGIVSDFSETQWLLLLTTISIIAILIATILINSVSEKRYKTSLVGLLVLVGYILFAEFSIFAINLEFVLPEAHIPAYPLNFIEFISAHQERFVPLIYLWVALISTITANIFMKRGVYLKHLIMFLVTTIYFLVWFIFPTISHTSQTEIAAFLLDTLILLFGMTGSVLLGISTADNFVFKRDIWYYIISGYLASLILQNFVALVLAYQAAPK